MLKEFEAVRDGLRAFYQERDDVITGMFEALIAGQHVLLLGPPGTAKSLLVRDLCSSLEDAPYFEWLLTKFTTPEEIFGPVSLKGLEEDVYRRITTNKLPEASIVFLDEMFKASSGILNALLTAINERVYHNNGHPVELPLEMMVGASNELPTEAELAALYDRLLVRFHVLPIQQEGAWVRMLLDQRKSAEVDAQISRKALIEAQTAVPQVQVGQTVMDGMLTIRRELRAMGITASDRRWKASLKLACAHAVLFGRDELEPEDLAVLARTMWEDPDEVRKVERAVAEIASPLDALALDALDTVEEIYGNVMYDGSGKLIASPSATAAAEANAKLKDTLSEINAKIKQGKADGKDVSKLQVAADRCKAANKTICEAALGMEFDES